MTTFVDYSYWQVSPAQLTAMGFSGAMRYLSHDSSKDLSITERDNLRAAGFDIGLVCESVANRAAQGYNAGHDDGIFYNAMADSLGYPVTCTLFYAVDFDAAPGQVQPYFDGVAASGGRLEAPYGGIRVIDGVHFRAPYGWQTAAWSGGHVSGRAGLIQDGFYSTYDSNTVLVADFGQWKAHSTPPAQRPPLRRMIAANE